MFPIPTPSLRTIAIVVGVLLVILLIWLAVSTLTGGKTAQVQARLDSALAGAAVSNAGDAVSVVEDRSASETALNQKVTHAQSAIDAATDVSGADAAGRDGLCAVAASFCPATGLQQSHSR